jgi:hypothetical protein
MTSSEFNNKYKEFLSEGHYGLSIDIESIVDYLDKEFQEFIKIEGFKYHQIKLKFGQCRFYNYGLSEKQTSSIETIVNHLAKQTDDSLMLEYYDKGYMDASNNKEEEKQSNSRLNTAYKVGYIDYIVGDDSREIDSQTNEQILKKIRLCMELS